MPNRLAHESSPYLLQHANNPVDWYPWGAEALGRSKSEDKPIFLSIGYSACHWCHVMEHESFENPEIAARLNANFIPVKVDREERPDLDQIYMHAVQLMTGRGGWPMSVFLTPGLQPFFGGTYWPPRSGRGMPGFDQVLDAVLEAWRDRRDRAIEQAAELTEHLQTVSSAPAVEGQLRPELLTGAAAALERTFDHQYGGFGGAPKFPHPMDLRLLLRVWRRTDRAGVLQMVTHTLDKMAAGGMYDQLGGGFHRYSVDARWLVPHFEKMLYDNALLCVAYLEAFTATDLEEYVTVAREICEYVLREMTDPAGGFYSTQDADSEGEEGKFFVWTPAELVEVLGPEAAKTFGYVYDVTELGNFEGHNILNRAKTIDQCAKLLSRDVADLTRELAESRAKLLAARESRVHPGLDDKVLVGWNGLMIDALAQGAIVLNEPRYLAAATKAAEFITRELMPGGKLLHTWRRGTAKQDAFLDDYASLAVALVSLYEAGFDEKWIDVAVQLCETMLARFGDPQAGGFFYTAEDHESLISRPRELYDNATPSASSLATTALVKLAKLTGRQDFADAAAGSLEIAAGVMQRAPQAAGQMLIAYDFDLGPTPEIVLLASQDSPQTPEILSDLRRRFVPNKIVALRAPGVSGSPHLEPLFAGKQSTSEEPTAWICENFTCQAPLHGVAAIKAAWDGLIAK